MNEKYLNKPFFGNRVDVVNSDIGLDHKKVGQFN